MPVNLDPTRCSSGPSSEAQPLPPGRGTRSPELVRDSLTNSPENVESPHSCLSIIWNAVCSLFRRLFFCFAASSQGEEDKEMPVQPPQENIGPSPAPQNAISRGYVFGQDGKLYRKTDQVNFIEDADEPNKGEKEISVGQGSRPPPLPKRDFSSSKEDGPHNFGLPPPAKEIKSAKRPLPPTPSGVIPFGAKPIVNGQNRTD